MLYAAPLLVRVSGSQNSVELAFFALTLRLLLPAAAIPPRLKATDVRREMRRLGLKFGTLPATLEPKLLEMFRGHEQSGAAARGDRSAINDVSRDIAEELPGGWSDKQVRLGTFASLCFVPCVVVNSKGILWGKYVYLAACLWTQARRPRPSVWNRHRQDTNNLLTCISCLPACLLVSTCMCMLVCCR